MRVRMLKTVRGAEDGFTLKTYEAGQSYQLADTPRGQALADAFIREKWAEPLERGQGISVGGPVLAGTPTPPPPTPAPRPVKPEPPAVIIPDPPKAPEPVTPTTTEAPKAEAPILSALKDVQAASSAPALPPAAAVPAPSPASPDPAAPAAAPGGQQNQQHRSRNRR